jgi:toxin ParE1/3/4
MDSSLEVRVAGPARRDIKAILKRSFREFGEAAARRYEALILQALRDLADDPERPGSQERPEIMVKGARTYHLTYSRGRVKGRTVGNPRHLLLYRRAGEQVLEIARILHDAQDLQRHLPESSSPLVIVPACCRASPAALYCEAPWAQPWRQDRHVPNSEVHGFLRES